MHDRGVFRPTSETAVRETYEGLGLAARTVVREVASAMDFDGEEYRERVTDDVVGTARDALFASLLSVTVGTREEFEAWTADHPDYEVVERGSPNVECVAWHAAPAAAVVVAATFQSEEDAAVATLQRQVYGGVYRDILDGA